MKSSEVKLAATRDAYGEALLELGEMKQEMVVLDGDLSGSTKTALFGDRWPDRFFNMGIAEQNILGTAAGLSLAGKLPFASTFAIFGTGRAWEQVRNTICYPGLNVKLVCTHAGLTVGEDGASHQALEDIALMRVLPNMHVFVPADKVEAKQAIVAAAELKGPVYVRLGRAPIPILFDDSYRFQPGKANRIREGSDVAILACGVMVARALEAAERLSVEHKVDARVINVASIKPLDSEEILNAAEACGALVTAEEHNRIGGLFGAVSETVAASGKPVPIGWVAVDDRFGESGDGMQLLDKYGLSVEQIVQTTLRTLERRG